jgi:hypothetical protein
MIPHPQRTPSLAVKFWPVHNDKFTQPSEILFIIAFVVFDDKIIYHLRQLRLDDTHKESLQINLHHIGILGIIPALFAYVFRQLSNASKLAFTFAAVIRSVTEYLLKKRFESQRDIVMDNAVSEIACEHFAIARIADDKADRLSDPILTRVNFIHQFNEIVNVIKLELRSTDCAPFSFPAVEICF